MKNGEFRIILAIVSLVLALVLFLGSFALYNKYVVRKPISEHLLAIKGVKAVSVEKHKQYEIRVTLDKVDNIQDTYLRIQNVLEEKLERKDYRLMVIDQRSNKLDKIYDRLQPAIYQALANNSFLWLDEQISKDVEDQGVVYHMFIDDQYLYIQISAKDSYLYEVIDRVKQAENYS